MRGIFRYGFFIIFLISFSFSGFAIRAEDSPPAQSPSKALTVDQFKAALPQGTAEELSLKGLLDLQKEGSIVILDVRSKESFAARHLKGSVNMPLTDLTEKTLPQAAPDKTVPVVLACDYSFFPVRMLAMTMQAYPVLSANGYEKIYRLNLWQDKGGAKMIDAGEQEKALEFEGADVHPPQPSEQ